MLSFFKFINLCTMEMKLICFLLLCVINNVLGTQENPYDLSIIKSTKFEDRLFTNQSLAMSTQSDSLKSFERNEKVKFFTTPLLSDDLLLEDLHVNSADENVSWMSANKESNDFSDQDRVTNSQNEGNIEYISTKTFNEASTYFEGSGDLLSSTIPEKVVPTSFTSPTITDTDNGDNSTENDIFEVCLQTVCNATEIYINSKARIVVQVASNITVTCNSSETHNFETLQWYFKNKTDTILKQESYDQNLSLILHNAGTWDSGTYKCLKKTGDFCCHTEVFISVYEIPDYRQDILIAGCVALIGFILCIVLTMVRKIQDKKYSELEISKQEEDEQIIVL